MDIQDLQFLYEYNYWARDRILEKAKNLTPQQFLEPRSYSHGSMRNTLVHILSAEWIWRMRCQEHQSPTMLLAFDDYPSVEALQLRMGQEEERMRAFLRGFTARELDQVITYHTTRGEPRKNILWHLLVHVVNHGTEHRSQAAAELTAFGYSPGNLDIIHFIREKMP